MSEKALYEKFENLLEEFNTTPYGVSKAAHVSQPTLSDWKLGKSEPKRATLEKICKAYGKTLSYFYGNDQDVLEPPLNSRDERDITKSLDHIMGEIRKGNDEPLYYNGVAIDEASLHLLANAFEFALRETKKENKVKYNPNKNKK